MSERRRSGSDAGFDAHPSWITAASTLVAYAIVLLGMFAALFAIPYAIVTFL